MQEKKEKMERRLLRAAIACMDKEGIEDFSIRKVARLAKTTVSPIYRHFDSKQKLLQIVIDRLSASFIEQMEACQDPSPRKELVKLVSLYFKKLNAHPNIYKLIFAHKDTKDGTRSVADRFDERVNYLINKISPNDEEFFLKVWATINGSSLLARIGLIKCDYLSIISMLPSVIFKQRKAA